jgi:glucan 1,3-beta-glucosidase
MTAMRGVNLGGWLVLEPWIMPSLFAGTDALDEYMFCHHASSARLQQLKRHRDTFITEQDFAWLAEQGIAAVRLPVGYWVFGDVEPFIATLVYVDKAFTWAKRYGLQVLLDLHGAPGSQNGEMHSGRQGPIGWAELEYIDQTLLVLERLAERYGRRPELLGISFLNEPSPHLPVRTVERFYRQACIRLKPLVHKDAWLIFSDTFRPWRWFWRLPPQDFPGLYVDYHHYQIFSWLDKWLPARLQLWRARHTLPGKLRRMVQHHPVIIGEWSGSLRRDKLMAMPAARQLALQRAYIQAQQQAFEQTDAWFYWTYRTEAGDAWSFRDKAELLYCSDDSGTKNTAFEKYRRN